MSMATEEPPRTTTNYNNDDEAHNETHGPKVGIRLTLEGANLILQRHLGQSAYAISVIDRGYNNRSYTVSIGSKDSYIIRLCGRFWTRMKTENEVAALLFLSRIGLPIPLPKILGFCSDREKSGVSSEYILMEKLEGVPLDDLYDQMDEQTRHSILRQIAQIFKAIQSVSFPKIGSLQFLCSVGDTFGIDLTLNKIKAEDIVVGPVLEAQSGPFESFLEFFCASVKREIDYLKNCEFLRDNLDMVPRIEAFLEALLSARPPIPLSVYENVPFVMTHGDFEPRNMLVDGTTITGIVDWEFSGSFPIDADFFDGFETVGVRTNEEAVFDAQGALISNACQSKEDGENLLFEVLREIGVRTKENIIGHQERAELYYFKCSICPWWMRESRHPIPPEWQAEKTLAWKRMDALLKKYHF